MARKISLVFVIFFAIFGYISLAKAENIYPEPPITPIENTHPRVLFTADRIEKIKSDMTRAGTGNSYNLVRYNSFLNMDLTGELQTGKPEAIVSEVILCNAFESIINNNAVNGKKAISMLTTAILDIDYECIETYSEYEELGWMVTVSACVYDWTYNLLSEYDKDLIREFMLTASSKQEVGYPPTGKSMVFTHGNEYQIQRDMLSAAIAIYDEYPDMYNAVAGRIFSESVEAKLFLNKSMIYAPGSKYIWRVKAEMYAVWLMDAIGYPNLYGEGYSELMRTYLYTRRPDGIPLADGDFSFNNSKVGSKVYNDSEAMTMVYGYYNDPFLKKMVRGVLNYSMQHPVEQFIFNNGNVESKNYDSLPLSKYLPSPKGAMVCRTGWDMESGKDSDDVVVEMKINEYNFAEHQHYDSGSFQIYYKGYLATDSGYYQASNPILTDRMANDGSTHCDSNYTNQYTRRSIAHNTMLVYDPNETFYDTAKLYKLENDGGQKAPLLWTANTGQVLNFFLDDSNGYHVGDILGHEIEGNSDTPDYTYLKGDLKNAYSSKVSEFTRSFMFLNLKNDEHPAALIVFDRVVSSNASYKKTFLCHGLFEPIISGNHSVFADTRDGYNGLLSIDTLLPKQDNLDIIKVGGYDTPNRAGAKVGNNIYYADIDEEGRQEGGGWRLEISPKEASEQDYFLNVLQVHNNGGASPLEVTLIDGDTVVGAKISDRVVMFGSLRERTDSAKFSFDSETTVKISVADMNEGTYIILKDGDYYCEVSADAKGGIVYFEGSGAEYQLIKLTQDEIGRLCFYDDSMIPVNIVSSRFARLINNTEIQNGNMYIAYYNKEGALIKVMTANNGDRINLTTVDKDRFIVGDYWSADKHAWGGARNACYIYNSNGAFYDLDTTIGFNNTGMSVHWNKLNETTWIDKNANGIKDEGETMSRDKLYARTVTDGTDDVKVLDKYQYVNAWIYSNNATDQSMQLRIYYKPDESLNPNAYTAGYHYLKSEPIPVNWTGWKLVSVKISEMTDNMQKYGGMYSWVNGDMKVSATGFQAYDNCNEIDVNIDSIWYSIEKPSNFDDKIAYIKAFYFESIDSLKPICDAATIVYN